MSKISVKNGAITLDVARVAASTEGRAVLEKIKEISTTTGGVALATDVNALKAENAKLKRRLNALKKAAKPVVRQLEFYDADFDGGYVGVSEELVVALQKALAKAQGGGE